MAAAQRPWKAEYAKSGRASCKSCRSPIAKDQLRLGKMVQATQFDGFMPMWNHASCIFSKKNQIKSVDDVDGIDALRWDDQERIRNYVGSASATTSSTAAVPDKCTIEVAPSARTSCRRCNEKITKGTVRVSAKLEGQGSKGVPWYHVNCFLDLAPSATVEKFSGWETLSNEDKGTVLHLVKKSDGSQEQSKGSKRKNGDNDMHGGKAPKLDGSVSQGTAGNKGKVVEDDSNSSSADLHQKLKEQSDVLWKLKDELKKHLSTAELRNMLEANEQDSSGPERHLLDRCADGMLFGALGPCPVCSGSLYYYNGQYQCSGNVSEWSKCTYSTTEPVRIKKKWKIPVGTENDFLTKWFKSQKVKKPVRVLPPVSPDKSGSKATQRARLLSSDGLDKLRFSIVGQSKEVVDEWIQKLKLSGASFHARVTKDINCLVSCGELDNENAEVRKARRLKIPIVREDYIGECVRKNRMLPFDLYKVESILESSKGETLTVKVKGRSAVHESSGLQDTVHESGLSAKGQIPSVCRVPATWREWSKAHDDRPCSQFTAWAMAHMGRATAPETEYNPEAPPTAYSNSSVHTRLTEHTAMGKQVHGPEWDPTTHDLDGEVIMRVGGGKKHGRYWIGEGSLDTTSTPSLSEIRARSTRSSPAIRSRPSTCTTQSRVDALKAQVEQERRAREALQASIQEEVDRRVALQFQQQQEALNQWMASLGTVLGMTLPPMPPFVSPPPPPPPPPASTPNQSAGSNA